MGQATPRGRSVGIVSPYPQLAVGKPVLACSSIPPSRRRTSGSGSSSTAAQQRTPSEPSGVRSSTGTCGGVSSSCHMLAAKAPISCCLPVAPVRAMQADSTDFIHHSLDSSNDGTTSGPSSDMHPGQQQQQLRTVQPPLPKRPASPSILAGCTTAAAGRGGNHKKQQPSSSSSSSEPPAGLTPAPQLLQYLQLPPGVKAMMSLPQSHSQHKYREQQRLELYALNALMARWGVRHTQCKLQRYGVEGAHTHVHVCALLLLCSSQACCCCRSSLSVCPFVILGLPSTVLRPPS